MSDPVKKGQKFQNREAFKAHRDIKRAVKDVTKENALKARACQGVCRRCVQKVIWRFKYEKYKGLRGRGGKGVIHAGNCSNCRQKCVQLAYRNLCNGCAKKRKLCPGCMKPPELAELADGEGAPEDDDDGASTDEEDLDGVVITHLSDNEDEGEDKRKK